MRIRVQKLPAIFEAFQVLAGYRHLWDFQEKNGRYESIKPRLDKWPQFAYHGTHQSHKKEFLSGFNAQGLFLSFNKKVALDYAADFHQDDGEVFEVDLKKLDLENALIEMDHMGVDGDAFIISCRIPKDAIRLMTPEELGNHEKS